MAARAAEFERKNMLDSLYTSMVVSITDMGNSSATILVAITTLTLLITGFSLGLSFLKGRKPKVV